MSKHWKSSVPRSIEHPLASDRANTHGTLTILEGAEINVATSRPMGHRPECGGRSKTARTPLVQGGPLRHCP
jgi:hypothetical protein